MAKHPLKGGSSSHNQLPNRGGSDQRAGYMVPSDPNCDAWVKSKNMSGGHTLADDKANIGKPNK